MFAASYVLVVCGNLIPLCPTHQVRPGPDTTVSVNLWGHDFTDSHATCRPIEASDEDALGAQEVLLS